MIEPDEGVRVRVVVKGPPIAVEKVKPVKDATVIFPDRFDPVRVKLLGPALVLIQTAPKPANTVAERVGFSVVNCCWVP